MTKVHTTLAGDSRGALFVYRFARNALVGFCRVWMRMTVEGRENVPATGAFILAPTHRSNLDTPIAAACTKRRMRFMGKDSLWKHQPARFVLSAIGGFPVARGSADREAITRSIELVKQEPLVLFPEGERKSGEVVEPLKDGAAFIAAKAGVPIIPVGIGGSERVMPKGAKFIYPRKVHVVIGKPIAAPTSANGRVPREQITAVSEQVRAELQRLFDDAQRKAGVR
jgi:1-acyl-sn-glycerol-3-phosphate acyltransferase